MLLDILKAGVAKATVTLVNHLDSERESIGIQAVEFIIAFAQKAMEHENLDKRIEALEKRIKQHGGKWR